LGWPRILTIGKANFYSSENHVGLLADGRDVRPVLASKAAEYAGQPFSFILMPFIEGIEMGLGATSTVENSYARLPRLGAQALLRG